MIATAGALFLLAGLMLLSMFSVTLAASVDLLPYLTTFRAAVTSFVRGTTTVMFGGAALVVVSLAAALFRWSRREQTPQATLESLERPILLLRSFSDDRRRVRANPGVRRSVVDAWSLRVGDHLEEILAWQVAEYGPLVAVGDPTTEQRRLGASRVHLEGGNWQAEVERMIRRAPLVVAVLGRSEGFLWEVDALVRAQALDRTVLVLPPISAREAGERLRLLDERLRNGGVLGFEPVRDPRRALCLGVRKGRVHAFVARKRDEAAYRAAVAMAASGLAAR